MPVEFVPQVSATCKAGVMNIKVNFNGPYSGAIHARDYRKPECMQMGDGSNSVALSINLLAKQGQSDYCGVLAHNVSSEVRLHVQFFQWNVRGNYARQILIIFHRFRFQQTEERSVQLAVRVHKTLELADDKFYVITCGKAGFGR